MTTGEALSVRVEVGREADVDDARLEALTASLRRELSELDVESVERAEGDSAPAGAKAGELLAVGALVVKVARSVGSVGAVVRALQDWAARGGKTVKLDVGGDTIEITGASRAQQDRLIEAWLERQGLT